MNTKYMQCFGVTCFLLLFFLIGLVSAQGNATAPAASFTDLRGRILPGMDITAIDSSGKALSGQVAEITDTVLVIENGKKKLTFSNNNLAEVRQQKQDSLLNGALIGAAVGGGTMGLLLAAWCGEEDCSNEATVGYAALYAGLGAGIGVLIDSLFKADVVVYRQTPVSIGVNLSGSTHSPGASLSVRW